MRFKVVALISLLTASAGLYAGQVRDIGEFGISNQTPHILSFSINNVCSADIGFVTGYSVKTVPVAEVVKTCSDSKSCNIVAYNQKNCTGDDVGGADINFIDRHMQVNSKGNSDISILGSMGLYQFNLFYYEKNGTHHTA